MLTQEQVNDPSCWDSIDVNKVDWDIVSYTKKLSENFIRRFRDKVDWLNISAYQKLSESFIREFQDKVDWVHISTYQQLSEEFIREFRDKIDWSLITIKQKLSEKFIREFQDKIVWRNASQFQKLSEEIIREFQDKVVWNLISQYQKLSEGFIREFQDKVVWNLISQYQKLSEGFIREFKHKVSWFNIPDYQQLSEEFIKEFIKEFNITVPENNWLYATIEEKRDRVKNFYELDGDYVIAYKSTRINGYSIFNFQYHYEVGGIYESNCDCNLYEENGFGLSAWTKQEALHYYPKGKLFKVRIHLDDLGAMVHRKKLRCYKLEVIEELQ